MANAADQSIDVLQAAQTFWYGDIAEAIQREGVGFLSTYGNRVV